MHVMMTLVSRYDTKTQQFWPRFRLLS